MVIMQQLRCWAIEDDNKGPYESTNFDDSNVFFIKFLKEHNNTSYYTKNNVSDENGVSRTMHGGYLYIADGSPKTIETRKMGLWYHNMNNKPDSDWHEHARFFFQGEEYNGVRLCAHIKNNDYAISHRGIQFSYIKYTSSVRNNPSDSMRQRLYWASSFWELNITGQPTQWIVSDNLI